MELSDKIRILRKARGYSQEGLGYNLSRVSKDGISRQSVSDWENGKSEPKLDNIRDLASVLDVSF
ncbi:MAG: helix-turn-helix domain-containing protein, partial [Corallococcus sp.]|nr:helix-turn-helix domain-containing protein [Corallococcus sp.]